MLQHQVYASITRRFRVDAGITRGMHVLEVGSGAGEVAMLLGDLVGRWILMYLPDPAAAPSGPATRW